MRIVNVDDNIIKELRKCDISTKMRSLESSDWIVYEQIDDKIMGAAGMGGLFHSSSINVHEKFRGKGLGKKIQIELVKEAKRKNCLERFTLHHMIWSMVNLVLKYKKVVGIY